MKGECAVCGTPVPAHLPPRKDPNTPRFCDDHDQDDLVKLSKRQHYERQQEQIQARFERR